MSIWITIHSVIFYLIKREVEQNIDPFTPLNKALLSQYFDEIEFPIILSFIFLKIS